MKNELGIEICCENCSRWDEGSCESDTGEPTIQCFDAGYNVLEARIEELLREKKEIYQASALCGAILKANGLKGCKDTVIAINELVAERDRLKAFAEGIANYEVSKWQAEYIDFFANKMNEARALLESEVGK